LHYAKSNLARPHDELAQRRNIADSETLLAS
jgi:hypothetical protein